MVFKPMLLRRHPENGLQRNKVVFQTKGAYAVPKRRRKPFWVNCLQSAGLFWHYTGRRFFNSKLKLAVWVTFALIALSFIIGWFPGKTAAPNVVRYAKAGETSWSIVSRACPNSNQAHVILQYHLPGTLHPGDVLRFHC